MQVFFTLPSTYSLASIALVLSIAVVIELRTRQIPNWLTFYSFLWGLCLALIDQDGGRHLAGATVGIIVGVTMFICNVAGGGIAKLIAAVGAVLGPTFPVVIAAVSLILLACVYVVKLISPPRQLRYADEAPPLQEFYGSLITVIGTAIGLAVQLLQ